MSKIYLYIDIQMFKNDSKREINTKYINLIISFKIFFIFSGICPGKKYKFPI